MRLTFENWSHNLIKLLEGPIVIFVVPFRLIDGVRISHCYHHFRQRTLKLRCIWDILKAMTFSTARISIIALTLGREILKHDFGPLCAQDSMFPIFERFFRKIRYLLLFWRWTLTLFKGFCCGCIAAFYDSSPIEKFWDYYFWGGFTIVAIFVFYIHDWVCVSILIEISHYWKFLIHKVLLFLDIPSNILYPTKTRKS